MKHLKLYKEHKIKEIGIFESTQTLFPILEYYYDILKNSTDYFKDFVICYASSLRNSNRFSFNTNPDRNSDHQLVSFEIRLMSNTSIMNFDIDDFAQHSTLYVVLEKDVASQKFENLSDLMYFLNLPGKHLKWHAEWSAVQLQIWKYAIEKNPAEALNCPTEILDKLKNKLAGPKKYGIFEKNENNINYLFEIFNVSDFFDVIETLNIKPPASKPVFIGKSLSLILPNDKYVTYKFSIDVYPEYYVVEFLKRYNDSGTWILINNSNHLNDFSEIMLFISQNMFNILKSDESWKRAELKIWEKAFDLDSSQIINCPPRILQKLKPKIDDIKNIGLLDLD